MEAEIRSILEDAVGEPDPDDLFTTLLDRFAGVGGVDLELPPRAIPPRAADIACGDSLDAGPQLLFTTSITVAEILYGIERLPNGPSANPEPMR